MKRILNPSKDKLSNQDLKQKALHFLERSDFHRNLRNEILFCLIPKTLTPGASQRHAITNMMQMLKYGGFLRDDGLFQLGVMKEFCKTINQKPSMTLKIQPITEFATQKLDEFSHWPITLLRGFDDDVEFFTSMAIKEITKVEDHVKLKLRNRLWLKLLSFMVSVLDFTIN